MLEARYILCGAEEAVFLGEMPSALSVPRITAGKQSREGHGALRELLALYCGRAAEHRLGGVLRWHAR